MRAKWSCFNGEVFVGSLQLMRAKWSFYETIPYDRRLFPFLGNKFQTKNPSNQSTPVHPPPSRLHHAPSPLPFSSPVLLRFSAASITLLSFFNLDTMFMTSIGTSNIN
ncbi:hypothetical protein L6452_37206 [Arctium lappa]|uniref:Uncharacterized protein n=1 Tax=Arctium lappa TaxID=4217 RepID=A0ACB8Y318_ARCLA|nr:hypothetical protein L6452_37206 [Arctium lappa]